MIDFLIYILTRVNAAVNAAGSFLLAPIGVLPGWLSNTLIAVVTGVVLLVIFKYTSNQQAIGKVRDTIKADMLTLKLFKDSLSITFISQFRLFRGALKLLFYGIVPLLIMIVPVSLLLAQMGQWYQARPLLPGEETVVTMKLNGNSGSDFPLVTIKSVPGAEVLAGPVRIFSNREISWKIKAHAAGCHHIVFQVDKQQEVEKELAVGDGFMRISAKRPGWNFSDVMLYPLEKPFTKDSAVQSISIDYPQRTSWTSGTNWWLAYFFVASLVFSLVFKPFLKVRI